LESSSRGASIAFTSVSDPQAHPCIARPSGRPERAFPPGAPSTGTRQPHRPAALSKPSGRTSRGPAFGTLILYEDSGYEQGYFRFESGLGDPGFYTEIECTLSSAE
jgi:hypothetical protein